MVELPIEAINGLTRDCCDGCRDFDLKTVYTIKDLRAIVCSHANACKRIEERYREEEEKDER